MRYFRIMFFLCLCYSASHAQVELRPAGGNAALRVAAAAEKAAFTDKYGDYFAELKTDCPPNIFFENPVTAGESISILFDTTDSNLMGDSITSTAILDDCSDITNGSASGLSDTNLRVKAEVNYQSNSSTLIGFDTLCVRYCGFEGACDTINIPVFIKRAGQSYDVDGPTLQAFSVEPEFCVDASLLEGELACSQVIFCEDDYDGEGQQIVQPTTFVEPVNCLTYQASGFPGEDLVCFVLCDEFTVCDTFNVTYTIESETLNLPFFEDFANNDSPYPSRDRWLDLNVYVNDTYAPNPPSIGMATFDGLDRGGTPYPEFGVADFLTSKTIDLENFSGDEDIYFKCYVAPKGYGLFPNEADSLVLEFRNSDREWVEVASWAGLPANPGSNVPFEFYSKRIEDAEFFHDAFQFRFFSYVSPGGTDDLWHLDYISIAANSSPDSIANDVAFTRVPPSILERYTAMPYQQFAADVDGELFNGVFSSSYFNHDLEARNISASSSARVTNITTGTQLSPESTVTDAATVNSQEFATFTRSNDAFSDDLVSALSNITEETQLEFNYSFDIADQLPSAFINDNTSTITDLTDYYAYDDGTSELTIVLINQINDQPQLAVRYQTNVEADLRAVQFQFPHLSAEDLSNQIFHFKIWIDEDGDGNFSHLNENEPDFRRDFLNPVYIDEFSEELQAFTTYALEDEFGEPAPLTIPAGADFYVAFQQVSVSDQGIPIGYDVQNDASDHTFVNLGGGWSPLQVSTPGALAIRAVFGDETPNDSSNTDDITEEANPVKIFPNPSSGLVEVSLENGNYQDYEVRVISNTGQHLRTLAGASRLDLQELNAGVYYLEFRDKNSFARYFRKIIILNE